MGRSQTNRSKIMDRRSFINVAAAGVAAGVAPGVADAMSMAKSEPTNDPVYNCVFWHVEYYDPSPGKELAKALASRAAEEWRKQKTEYHFAWEPDLDPDSDDDEFDAGAARLRIFHRGELVHVADGFIGTILGEPKLREKHEFDYVVSHPLYIWSRGKQ
jgi:hypothetical protein